MQGNHRGGRNGLLGQVPLAPTCYIQQTITSECATRPTGFDPALRGVVEMANGPGLVPGAVCGTNTTNAHLPCLGGYCSDEKYGVCLTTNALGNPYVNLNYVRYGTRL